MSRRLVSFLACAKVLFWPMQGHFLPMVASFSAQSGIRYRSRMFLPVSSAGAASLRPMRERGISQESGLS